MTIRVLFFGMLKEIIGRADERLEVDEGSTLADVFAHYARLAPRLKELSGSIVVAQNHAFSQRSAAVLDNAEIAFLPPVSGGSGPWTHAVTGPAGHLFALTRQTIDVAALRDQVVRPGDGAIVVFEGVVRDNSHGRKTRWLDYECYEAMAVEVMAAIGNELAGAYEIGRIAIVHRLGRIEIGQASVVIVVSAPHRRPAFQAALDAIDRLKKTVPVWKKEYFEDGEIWVEGEWDSSVAGR